MLITVILKNLKFSKNFQTHCTWSRCEDFVKFLSPSLSELKVTPNFCFALKFRDDPTASNAYMKPVLKNLIAKHSESVEKSTKS